MNEYEKMFYDVVVGADELPPNLKESIDCALNNLKDEYRCILIERYGLDGNKPATYKEIGAKHGISLEAVRNRYAKAIRMLRYPSNYMIIKYGIEEAKRIQEKRNSGQRSSIDSFDDFCEQDISEAFELSIRTYNSMKRSGINTVKELISCTNDELLKMRNLGSKSLDEVVSVIDNALRGFGLTRDKYLKSIGKLRKEKQRNCTIRKTITLSKEKFNSKEWKTILKVFEIQESDEIVVHANGSSFIIN